MKLKLGDFIVWWGEQFEVTAVHPNDQVTLTYRGPAEKLPSEKHQAELDEAARLAQVRYLEREQGRLGSVRPVACPPRTAEAMNRPRKE